MSGIVAQMQEAESLNQPKLKAHRRRHCPQPNEVRRTALLDALATVRGGIKRTTSGPSVRVTHPFLSSDPGSPGILFG